MKRLNKGCFHPHGFSTPTAASTAVAAIPVSTRVAPFVARIAAALRSTAEVTTVRALASPADAPVIAGVAGSASVAAAMAVGAIAARVAPALRATTKVAAIGALARIANAFVVARIARTSNVAATASGRATRASCAAVPTGAAIAGNSAAASSGAASSDGAASPHASDGASRATGSNASTCACTADPTDRATDTSVADCASVAHWTSGSTYANITGRTDAACSAGCNAGPGCALSANIPEGSVRACIAAPTGCSDAAHRAIHSTGTDGAGAQIIRLILPVHALAERLGGNGAAANFITLDNMQTAVAIH
ncbi:hypothetical protein HPT29_023050 [Microvirga terrae]|uniref:Uncharacterized protein n=1 Tax=Microvirga terrae TaxID=2740529 RepID=A0ABY5RPT1_9HYPH|nr:hypothetical protein [Microvirga terrae]UVF19276.1 hypothetical protein HPT29_023050 [Microvirga terrae]